MWDPERYLAHAEERGRPFFDLMARVGAVQPRTVVDLGCGPGQLTATLAKRWPDALITGIDSSPEMIAAARAAVRSDRVQFQLGDLREWRPSEPVDVLIANAVLQWVPEHLRLLPRLIAATSPGGWLALQVPGNFDAPSHRILRQLASEPRWGIAGQVALPSVCEPVDYLAALAGLGNRVDVWETTYLHVLRGPDPVFQWLMGTGARPFLAALAPEHHAAFANALRERLHAAYPPLRYGTVLPFRRIFVVARSPGGEADV